MAKLPFMQFFPADWLLDTLLLSPAARGIWIDILSFMWRDEPRTGVMECTVAAWCKRLRCSDADFRTVVQEFELERICDVMKDECKDIVRFMSRRIVRDENIRVNGKLYVRKHRSKNACKENVRSVKGPCKGDISESEVIFQNQNHISDKEDTTPLPPSKGGMKERGKTAFPKEWKPEPSQMMEWTRHGLETPYTIFATFRDHALATDRRCKDWDAAWRNWCRKELRMKEERANGLSKMRI